MTTSIFDTWAQYVVAVLKAESELTANLTAHPTLIGDAREFIVESVLKRILPPTYEIGRGQIVDSFGNRSRQIDIVIARSDSPSLTLPGGDKIYLIESVLATLEVKSFLGAEHLVEALKNCASVADLVPGLHGPSIATVLDKRNAARTAEGRVFHVNHLEFQRLSTLGYPATYVFGFKGYIENATALLKAIETWLQARDEKGNTTFLRHLPSLIATEGCFAFRNETPFNVSPDDPEQAPTHYPAGSDPNPLRLLVFHLLNTLFAKMPWAPDIEGLRMEPRGYLAKMRSGDYENGITFPESAHFREVVEAEKKKTEEG